jgi:hypothetical protein
MLTPLRRGCAGFVAELGSGSTGQGLGGEPHVGSDTSHCYENVSRTAEFWLLNLRRMEASSDISPDIIMKTGFPAFTCARRC